MEHFYLMKTNELCFVLQKMIRKNASGYNKIVKLSNSGIASIKRSHNGISFIVVHSFLILFPEVALNDCKKYCQ